MTIFGLKMIVKSGQEFFILKSYVPLQRYNKGFQNKKSRSFFTIIFKAKTVVLRVKILVHLFQPF